MNKKVSEQFRYIKDVYLLQCICTEQNDYIENQEEVIQINHKQIDILQERINKAIEYIEDNSDDMHTYISQVLTDILKGSSNNE